MNDELIQISGDHENQDESEPAEQGTSDHTKPRKFSDDFGIPLVSTGCITYFYEIFTYYYKIIKQLSIAIARLGLPLKFIDES